MSKLCGADLRRIALAFAGILILLPGLAAAQSLDRAIIETDTGRHEFTIEYAASPEDRARGLMYRQSMVKDHGMLFDFGRDGEVNMWMKNTFIPLDMVFIRADGTVHRVAERTTPFSTETIPSRGPVRAVLEIAGGVADEIGLKPGDTVHHPMFSNLE